MTDKKQPSPAFLSALNAVSKLGQDDFTTVPRVPTTTMLTAGARAGEVTESTAWAVYVAMVNAVD